MIRLALLLIVCPIAHGAHSRRRLVAFREASPKYDRSITTFSSEGRLLQVEYGMEASSRGETVAAIVHPDGVLVAVGSPALEKVHRIDAHIFLITAGLAPDSRALAVALRNACQRFRMENGEPPTVKEVAEISARFQHDLTKMGGARPFGCTATIVGIDPTNVSAFNDGNIPPLLGRPRLFQTDPGGIVEEYYYCAAGKCRSHVMKELENVHDQFHPKRWRKLHETCQDLAVSITGVLEKFLDSPTEISVLMLRPNQYRRGGTDAVWIDRINRRNVRSINIVLERSLEKP